MSGPSEPSEHMKSIVILLRIIAIISLALALYLAKSFVVPVLLGLVIALTLNPVVEAVSRMGIPKALSSASIMIVFFTAVYFAATALSGPFNDLVSDAPRIAAEVQYKLRNLRQSVDQVSEMEKEVKKAAGGEKAGVQEVKLQESSILFSAADDVLTVAGMTIFTMVLTFFFLTTGDIARQNLVRAMPKLSDKKEALKIAREVEHDVSHYLLTVSVINVFLGAAVGTALWLLGMPNPILWGALAALLNFMPYLGAGIGIVASTCFAVIAMPSLSDALLVPMAYLLINLAEGQFITPVVLGKRFSINTIAVLLALAFGGFLWGAVGVFLAMPLLIMVKALSNHVPGMRALGELLHGARRENQQIDPAAA